MAMGVTVSLITGILYLLTCQHTEGINKQCDSHPDAQALCKYCTSSQRKTPYKVASDKGCHHYITCSKDRKVYIPYENPCPSNKIFVPANGNDCVVADTITPQQNPCGTKGLAKPSETTPLSAPAPEIKCPESSGCSTPSSNILKPEVPATVTVAPIETSTKPPTPITTAGTQAPSTNISKYPDPGPGGPWDY